MISLAFSLSDDFLDPHPHPCSPHPSLLPRSQSFMITRVSLGVNTEAFLKKSLKRELQAQWDPGAQLT